MAKIRKVFETYRFLHRKLCKLPIESPIGDELWIVEYDFKYYEKLFSMAEADAPAGNGDRSHTESHLLAEEVGGEDEEDHEDGEDEEGDLQPLV